jgi:hypothetical protein
VKLAAGGHRDCVRACPRARSPRGVSYRWSCPNDNALNQALMQVGAGGSRVSDRGWILWVQRAERRAERRVVASGLVWMGM